ncbi:hypothetical protein AH224_04710 [Salmonella enterica]|nr:hypothetical protein [Salmonella enterica]
MSCFQVLRRGSPECNAMQCNAMQCNAMQCNAMQCNAMQCNAMQCNNNHSHSQLSTCFCKKNAVDGIFFLSECKYTINPAGDKE